MLEKSAYILVVTAALLGALASTDAEAARPRAKRFELVSLVRSPDPGARGVVRVRRTRHGARVALRLRSLEPGVEYEARDADDGVLLGSVVANGRGRARLRVRLAGTAGDASGKVASDGPEAVAVYRAESGRLVLLGDDDGTSRTAARSRAAFGDAYYGTLRGTNANASLFSDGEGRGMIAVLLRVFEDGAVPSVFELRRDSLDGDLPGGAARVLDLAGRGFEIVDGDGVRVLGGELPVLRPLDEIVAGAWDAQLPPAGDEEDVTEHVAPFTLRVAGDGGALEDAGQLTRLVDSIDIPTDFEWADVGFGRPDGVSGLVSLLRDATAECFEVRYSVATESLVDHHYSASRYGATGALPLGVESLDDLAGRGLQIRDHVGTVLVERLIPSFEDGGAPEPYDGAVLEAGVAPLSVWIQDAVGAYTHAGEMIMGTYTGPAGGGWWDYDGRAGGLYYGDYFGTYASVSLLAMSNGHESVSISMFVAAGSIYDGTTHQYTGSNLSADSGLPLGVDRVADLSGRAFELRDAAGVAVIADVLPELEEIELDIDGPIIPEGAAFDPGEGPYSLWIADDAGVLVEIATLDTFESSGP